MGDGLFSLLAHGRCGKFEVSVYWFHDLFYDIYIVIIVCAFSDNWICPGCSRTARELWALFKFGESFRNPCFYNLQWKNCLGMATVLPFIQWDQTFGMYYKSKQQITWTYPWLRGLVKINTTILIVFCCFVFRHGILVLALTWIFSTRLVGLCLLVPWVLLLLWLISCESNLNFATWQNTGKQRSSKIHLICLVNPLSPISD